MKVAVRLLNLSRLDTLFSTPLWPKILLPSGKFTVIDGELLSPNALKSPIAFAILTKLPSDVERGLANILVSMNYKSVSKITNRSTETETLSNSEATSNFQHRVERCFYWSIYNIISQTERNHFHLPSFISHTVDDVIPVIPTSGYNYKLPPPPGRIQNIKPVHI